MRVGIVAVLCCATAVHAALEISSKATSNVTCSSGVCTATAKKAVLNVSDLVTMLASGDVKVVSGSVAQDIEMNAALSWTSTHALTLDSYHSIDFNRPLTVAGLGTLTITTNDGGAGGDFQFIGKGHVEFWDIHAQLFINGDGYGLVRSLPQLIKSQHRFARTVALAKSYDAAKDGTYQHSPIPRMEGRLEGLGNTISNLSIDDSTPQEAVALIAFCEGSPGLSFAIRDLGLVSVHIVGSGFRQGVAALAESMMYYDAKNVYATGTVSAIGSGSVVAGLIGGSYLGTISQSHSDVAVSNSAGPMAGGLLGKFTGCDSECGGLRESIEKSYATGSVTAGDGATVGGLVADHSAGPISDSYSMASVQAGAQASVGGLVGLNEGGDIPNLGTSYSTGAVSGGQGSTIGGLIGQDLASNTINNTYWDLDTSGVSNPHQGAGNIPDDPGITGLADAQLKSGLPAGFDPKIWAQNPTINNGYPYLINNPSPK